MRRRHRCLKADKMMLVSITRMTTVNLTRMTVVSWNEGSSSCQIVTDTHNQWLASFLTKAVPKSTVEKTSTMESRYTLVQTYLHVQATRARA